MENLQDIYRAIDRLNNEELEQVQAYINQRRQQPQIADEDVQAKIAALREAFAEIREGMTPEELQKMIDVMNSEYIEPIDPADYTWLDGKDED
jgi:uncharacterized protein YeeX (DUF496 family)